MAAERSLKVSEEEEEMRIGRDGGREKGREGRRGGREGGREI